MVKGLSYYQDLYAKTAYDYLEKIKNGISQLLKNPHNAEIINDIYISTHSLKSQSLAMGYKQTADLSSAIQDIFEQAKENRMDLSENLLKKVMVCTEKLTANVDNIKTENKELDLAEDVKDLSK